LSAFPADVWFPDLDAAPEWEAVEEGPVLEEKGLRFRYVTYRRR
jgi:dihydrofolate reductase